jgi:hypothetical protein
MGALLFPRQLKALLFGGVGFGELSLLTIPFIKKEMPENFGDLPFNFVRAD